MKKIIIFIFGFFAFSFLSARVFAANVEVAGKVNTDGQVKFANIASGEITTVGIDPNGLYSISLPQGNYDISFIAPQGSNISEVTKKNVRISTNDIENITVPINTGISAEGPFARVKNMILYVVGIVLFVVVILGIYFIVRKNRRN